MEYFAVLLFLSLGIAGVRPFKAQSFIYQKDMSEHCRRRVMSSVFLGRHVTEAHSQILHFSQLEVPYSCAISIRAEPGSNIVLVLELKNVTESCRSDNVGLSNGTGQVTVHDMGETFGGYWGILPDDILDKTPLTPPRFYTIVTPPATLDYTDDISDLIIDDRRHKAVELNVKPLIMNTTAETKEPRPGPSYVTVKVPLVDVSGMLVDSDTRPQMSFHEDEMFDIVNNVTPKPGVIYSTTMVPLLKYSIHRYDDRRYGVEGNVSTGTTVDGRRLGDIDDVGGSVEPGEQRYAIDYEIFTPDPRLKYPFLESILSGKQKKFHRGQKFNANKILKFRPQNNALFHRISRPSTKHYDTGMSQKTLESSQITAMDEASKFLDELITALNRSQENQVKNKNDMNHSHILERIANIDHNFSVYLSPNLSMYDNMLRSFETKDTGWSVSTIADNYYYGGVSTHKSIKENVSKITNTIKRSSSTRSILLNQSSTSEKNTEKQIMVDDISLARAGNARATTTIKPTTKTSTQNIELEPSTQIRGSVATTSKVLDLRTTHLKVTQSEKSSTSIENFKPSEPLPIHTVNHESWENIVQAAPKLANILNISTPIARSRRKRLIQAIDIEVARPRNITKRLKTKATPESVYYFTDRQDFAQLVELQDDEIVGRIALRHIRRYVGNLLLDVCDAPFQKSRQVFLFNTSRILLTINDFTVKRMTLVVTPARTLSSQEGRCPNQHLECQVSGARVCIDSMCACDGVPNCGSYDVYDEDRLRCNKDKGSQHSVYLAAFAFLAVLFTGLYTVHYWLRRCVPKVSDAFFIYTDGTENILYLDTIMKSPTSDKDDGFMYGSTVFIDASTGGIRSVESVPKDTSKMGLLKRIFRCCRRKASLEFDSLDAINLDLITAGSRRQKIFSFAEGEITKIGYTMVDETTQTGESMEMQFIEKIAEKKLIENQIRALRRNTDMGRLKIDDLVSTVDDVEKSRDSELSMLKFMKEARASGRRASVLAEVPEDAARARPNTRHVAVGDEREMHSTLYDSHIHRDSLSSDTQDVGSYSQDVGSYSNTERIKPCTSAQARKQLRFNDNLLSIPSDDGDEEYVSNKRRQSAFLGVGGKPLVAIHEDEGQEHSAARDFKRFWSSNKGNKKPAKKKNQSSLR